VLGTSMLATTMLATGNLNSTPLPLTIEVGKPY
jgi:hypothetical protein